ncbi:MAG: hypothetical protein B7Y25_02420 [Alphaproteobacteria bacterium 16-39-46]|nr:MAG: hypothetical protein B7Y25_02420 [Alphaproteobacteria bacterium 16-39-46]OZA43580.1 MAG: hypothetical protein B7X84_02715 [Alphaproteobacteria bacterium 17-39-52]
MNIEKIVKRTFFVGLIIAGVGILFSQGYAEEDSDDLTEKKRCVSHEIKLDKNSSTTYSTCKKGHW